MFVQKVACLIHPPYTTSDSCSVYDTPYALQQFLLRWNRGSTPRSSRACISASTRRFVGRFAYELLRRPMSEFDTSPIVLRSIAGNTLDAATLLRLGGVVPEDELREKRLANLKIARQVIIALRSDLPVGLVYVRTIAGIPNVTWLVAESARGRGLAVRMLARLQEDWPYLTAICRNQVSVAVAERSGFAMAGPFALWIRRRKVET